MRDGHAGPRGWRLLRGIIRGLVGVVGLGALAVTIALTIPRFVDPQSYRVVQLASAAPFGLITGAVAIVLLLGPALSRGRGRLLSTVATIVAVGMTALHAWWLAPLFTGTVPAAQPGKTLTPRLSHLWVGAVSRAGWSGCASRSVCVAPVTIGRWALVAAGSVVTKDVPDFALVAGVPARGWVGKAGTPLEDSGDGLWTYPDTRDTYREVDGVLSPQVG